MGPLVPINGNNQNGNTNALSQTATTGSNATSGSQGLGQNDFLQLLVTQLQYQDPTQPMDNQAFIAEMAQFQTLSSMQQIQQQDQSIQNATEATEALALVGKTVQLTDNQGNTVTGAVSAVSFQNGVPQLVVNDQKYDLSMITEAANG